MAITSFGYKGTIDEVQWAQLAPVISSARYGVQGDNDLAVTAVAGADRTVRINTGTAWGSGVMDYVDAAETLQLQPVASGDRWDMVAVRREWALDPSGRTAIVAVTGTASKALPPSRQASPGSVDEQPLALVRVVAGQTQPAEIIDLRCWASNGGAQILDEVAFQYLAEPGATVWFKWRMWVYMRNEAGSWIWDKIGDMGTRATLPLNGIPNWKTQGTIHATQDPPHRITTIMAQIYRDGSTVTVPSDRWLALGYILPDQFKQPREPYTGETVQVFPVTVRTVGAATSFTSTFRNAIAYLDVRDGTFRIQSAEGSSFTIPQWGRIYVHFSWNVPFEA